MSICLLRGALGAEYLLVASLGKVGASTLFNVKLLHVQRAEVLYRSSRPIKGDEDQLIDAVHEAVSEAVANAAKRYFEKRKGRGPSPTP